MVAATEQQQFELMEFGQLEALERMLAEMCERLTEIVEETLEGDALESREARFQLEAFEERRNRALKTLDGEQIGPLPVKIGKLERLIEALECSWVYFNGLAGSAGISQGSSRWSAPAE